GFSCLTDRYCCGRRRGLALAHSAGNSAHDRGRPVGAPAGTATGPVAAGTGPASRVAAADLLVSGRNELARVSLQLAPDLIACHRLRRVHDRDGCCRSALAPGILV